MGGSDSLMVIGLAPCGCFGLPTCSSSLV